MRRLLLNLPRQAKRVVVAGADAALCVSASWLGLSIIAGDLVIWSSLLLAESALASVCIALPIFLYAGLYNAIFRYLGLNALVTLGKALLAYSAVHLLVVGLVGLPGVPRSLGLLQPLLLLVMMVGLRLGIRVWLDDLLAPAKDGQTRVRVLIFGAGSAGRQLAAALFRSPQHHVVGYLDDDDRLWGHTLDGVRVYNPQQLSACMAKARAQEVLLAIPSATRQRRTEIIDDLREHPVHVRTLPSLADLASTTVDLGDVRELEIEDLLGRDPVPPNALLLNRNIRGKVVMVTGAGGSIGSELCRQITACAPKQLLLVDNSEFALYEIHQELQEAGAPALPLLASVADEPRMAQLMNTWRPHTVYHAAAFKHVPMVEHNPAQGLLNNVWGTLTCARAAVQAGVQHFVLVSTDKAVRPTNIMGASKRLAEMVLQALADAGGRGGRTCFSMVRFGNVLGSSGSVVPRFREQIRQGGPITLTHPDITRYFMTIPEAAQLVIQAGAMASGGDVFVLDMGKPVRVMDLARRLVELSGLTVRDATRPNGDIEIITTGLRPGEKLFEELLIGDNPQATQHPRIMKATEPFLKWDELQAALQHLQQCVQQHDVPGMKALLQDVVSGYEPAEGVVDWVWVQQHGANTAGLAGMGSGPGKVAGAPEAQAARLEPLAAPEQPRRVGAD
ncbi:MAG: hypothetical protein RI949_2715 [Pseudomonadota bacterium]